MIVETKNSLLFQVPVLLIYAVLGVPCLNNCYFWDTIQQISKEAHGYYQTGFSSLLPPATDSGSGVVATGYHPPLMGIVTAALWKIFGYRLWVSHAFTMLWAVVLVCNVCKLLTRFFSYRMAGWVMLIVMLEPTVLTQFAIASPDFILLTAFIVALRGMLEHKPRLLALGMIVLCTVNMRGVFAGAALLAAQLYYSRLQAPKALNLRSVFNNMLPYLPALVLTAAYFGYYFATRGWFFTHEAVGGHYSLPSGVGAVVKHLAEYGLRSVENGRIVIWLIGIYVAFHRIKKMKTLSAELKALLLLFVLLAGLYLLLGCVTRMPFSARYFMPQFFLLTVLVLKGLTEIVTGRKIVVYLIVVLCFELTGHLWIYPRKIAKSWDCTLAHLPYYGLRAECFQYIDKQGWNYKDISGSFCLYGNRRFTELGNADKTIGTSAHNKYFIYSNISNVDDSLLDELENPMRWTPVRQFEKGAVLIIIYEQKNYQ